MRPRLRLALAILALLLAPPLAAQVVREVQVPLDPERGVVEVTPDLRRELGLFPEVAGFESARLFRQDDGALILEPDQSQARGVDDHNEQEREHGQH